MLVATREGRTWLFPRTVLFHHRLLAFRLPVSVPLFPCSLPSTLLSVPLAHARTRHISLSFFRSIRTAPFHENSRRSLAWAISSSVQPPAHLSFARVSLSPCTHPCTLLFLPALKPFRRFKSPSCAHPLEDRPCLVYAALVASFPPCARRTPPFSFAPLAWPERRFLFVAVLRGSTTTEKRTALFVWRSIATRQLRDCNVGTVKPTLLPSTLFPSFPVTLCTRIIVSSSASKFLVTSSGSNSKYLRCRFVRVTKRADQVYRHVRTVSCLVRVFRNDAVDTAGYSLVTKVALRLRCSRVLREIFGISGCQELCSTLGYTYILRSWKFRAERNRWLF